MIDPDKIYLGDCREVMKLLDDNSIDSIVTDPPYGLDFMGKGWDHGIPGVEFWTEALRAMKPGAHLLAFGGTRTYHRLTCAIEDAGFEIRDCLMWIYGSGFPKSLNISKALDDLAGADNVIGYKPDRWTGKGNSFNFSTDRDQAMCKITEPTTDAAKQWDGWGTGLKPAWEPIILARKPPEGTIAENILKWGTGGLNVDGCRISGPEPHHNYGRTSGEGMFCGKSEKPYNTPDIGRWPANLLLDEESAALLDEQTGTLTSGANPTRRVSAKFKNSYGKFQGAETCISVRGQDAGGASRFFYCAKASREEREIGLSGLPARNRTDVTGRQDDAPGQNNPRAGIRASGNIRNTHPTVKPISLMEYLCRLVTPPSGLTLDMFAGSGTTCLAAQNCGFKFIGIETEQEYQTIAAARVKRRYNTLDQYLPKDSLQSNNVT